MFLDSLNPNLNPKKISSSLNQNFHIFVTHFLLLHFNLWMMTQTIFQISGTNVRWTFLTFLLKFFPFSIWTVNNVILPNGKIIHMPWGCWNQYFFYTIIILILRLLNKSKMFSRIRSFRAMKYNFLETTTKSIVPVGATLQPLNMVYLKFGLYSSGCYLVIRKVFSMISGAKICEFV